MNKLLSCRYNMDTNRVEARFDDGTSWILKISSQEAFISLLVGMKG